MSGWRPKTIKAATSRAKFAELQAYRYRWFWQTVFARCTKWSA